MKSGVSDVPDGCVKAERKSGRAQKRADTGVDCASDYCTCMMPYILQFMQSYECECKCECRTWERKRSRDTGKTKRPKRMPLRGASGHAAHGGIVGAVVAIVGRAVMPGGPR